MPFHKEYADGSPRPVFRGWLHGAATLVFVPMVIANWSSIPAPAVPGMVSISYSLILSSLVHLFPWKSVSAMNTCIKLDKSGILSVCGMSFWAPQLLQNASLCQPSYALSVGTVAAPIALAILGIFCGAGPIAFSGCAVAFASTMWFYGTQIVPMEFFGCCLGCLVLYGTGLAMYAFQVGGYKQYWGYHEWMHLLITIGILVNVRGLLVLSDLTDETCRPDLFVQEESFRAQLWNSIARVLAI